MSGEPFLDQYFNESPLERRSRDDASTAKRSGVAEGYVAAIDLHLADGSRVALPYATLLRTTFDSSKGVTLEYSTDTVTITGYRLESIYKAIAHHRLAELKAAGETEAMFSKKDGGPVVTAIRRRPADE